MPSVGDFLFVQEAPVTLPKADPPQDVDHTYDVFNAPALNTNANSILFFRVNPTGTVTLRVTLNNTDVLTQTFDSEPQRSWHESIGAGVLLASNNVLTITRTAGPGSVTLSDMFMHYQANI